MPGIVFQGSRQQINKVVGNREGMSHGAVAQKPSPVARRTLISVISFIILTFGCLRFNR
jgi:hypothetical protein